MLKILGLQSDASGQSTVAFGEAINLGRTTDPAVTGGYVIRWARAGSFTCLVVRRDPGEPVIWLGFAVLLAGLAVSFYLPRCRVWVRLAGDGSQLAVLAERGVRVEREFGRLLDDIAWRIGERADAGKRAPDAVLEP